MLNSSKKPENSKPVKKPPASQSFSKTPAYSSLSSPKPPSSLLSSKGFRKTSAEGGSLLKFAFDLSLIKDIPSFLLKIRSCLPKKMQAGEIVLFYECALLGLRRASLKTASFHEESVKLKWPELKSLRFSKPRETLCLARELGRPVSKALIVPLSLKSSLLFIELNPNLRDWIAFFEKRAPFLELQFERIYQSQRLRREASLWIQLFSHWREPMAVLKGFQVLKSNSSFKELFSGKEESLRKIGFSGSVKARERAYQLSYHPLEEGQAFFYAQDMSKYFSLKEQLFQTEKMLGLFELGQNMAHQLNNPLTGVRAMTQILRRNPRLESFKEEFQELEKAIGRSQQIIQSFLSFSEVGKELKSCDLNQVIEDSLPLLKSMTKRISLIKSLHKGELKVRGDFALLQQITYNLILNACQSLLEDKEIFKAELRILTDKISGDRVRMRVIDNGKGVPQENLDKIFKPLWTNRKNGTGFGLGITKKIVKKYGGDISVSSQERKQTCFTVSLPLYCPETLLDIIDSA